MRQAFLLVLALGLSVSAFAAKQPPVSVTVGAPFDAVRGAAVSVATANGYILDREGQFQITFTKNMTGMAGFVTNLLLTPSACSEITPRWLLTVVFAPGQNGVTLHAVSQYEHAGPFCQPVRDNLDGKKPRQQIEAFFEQIKETAESQTTATAVSRGPSVAAATAPQPDASMGNVQEQSRVAYAEKLTAELQKEATGYASLEGPNKDVLIVHSTHADAARFNNLLLDQRVTGPLHIYGFSKFVYTNDQGNTYTWVSDPRASEPSSPLVPQQPTYSQSRESYAGRAASDALTVDFSSRPTGATVSVDGVSVGSTPLSLSLTQGEHRIRISKEDFRAYDETVTINTDHQAIDPFLEQTVVRFGP
jgi:hypothetical protein